MKGKRLLIFLSSFLQIIQGLEKTDGDKKTENVTFTTMTKPVGLFLAHLEKEILDNNKNEDASVVDEPPTDQLEKTNEHSLPDESSDQKSKTKTAIAVPALLAHLVKRYLEKLENKTIEDESVVVNTFEKETEDTLPEAHLRLRSKRAFPVSIFELLIKESKKKNQFEDGNVSDDAAMEAKKMNQMEMEDDTVDPKNTDKKKLSQNQLINLIVDNSPFTSGIAKLVFSRNS